MVRLKPSLLQKNMKGLFNISSITDEFILVTLEKYAKIQGLGSWIEYNQTLRFIKNEGATPVNIRTPEHITSPKV